MFYATVQICQGQSVLVGNGVGTGVVDNNGMKMLCASDSHLLVL